MAKRIMREFRMDEISAVDKPAQVHAKMVLMKRQLPGGMYAQDATAEDAADGGADDAEEGDGAEPASGKKPKPKMNPFAAKKNLVLVSEEDGHVHLIDGDATGGETSLAKMDDSDAAGHSHPWARSADGTITLGEELDHTHTVSLEKSDNDDDALPDGSAELSKDNKETDMNPEEVKKLEAQLAYFKALSVLSDAEKTYHKALSEADQLAFVAKSADERSGILAKADTANPVVFTSKSGETFRKNDDPRLVAMAKQADADREALQAAGGRETTARLEKRASTELTHLPGDAVAKVALLRAVEGIADEPTRTAIGALLKANNEAMAKAFKTLGTSSSGSGEGETPVQKLDSLAKAHAAATKVPFNKAYTEVLNTAEGQALYAESQKR